jgi:Mrp family chromosome partitioning ATPase
VFPSGDISINPADLLLNSNLESLFNELKSRYDYIIVDSAPTALVSDPFILAQFSDVELFVIRQRKTLKKQLDFLADIFISKRMNNVGLIFNDIKTGGKFGYYGYGGTNGKGYENNYDAGKKKRNKQKVLVS